ncbi:MAG: sugar phosphate isomerase/epimerase [Bryobacterales bacterium]|nr:sugar phosphate isomerase/epimerase [Bryobacterales bacterium]
MRRRVFLALAAARAQAVRLSLGTYGMQTIPVDRALASIGELGYDGAELCLMAGWPSEPVRLDGAARRRIREQRLPIPSMIENFNLLADESGHARTLDRIRVAAALAHDVSPKAPPQLQSVLGGRPGEWEQVKEMMAARLAEWARVAADNRLRLAVKSHVGSASDTPEKLIWLLDKAGNPALSGIYDYGHFQLLGLGLRKTLDTLLPRSSFVTVKDGRMVDGKAQFLLPGEGTIDYRDYFSALREKKYGGWILVEISRQLQMQPGYDALAAARRSYENLAPLLRAAGLR